MLVSRKKIMKKRKRLKIKEFTYVKELIKLKKKKLYRIQRELFLLKLFIIFAIYNEILWSCRILSTRYCK